MWSSQNGLFVQNIFENSAFYFIKSWEKDRKREDSSARLYVNILNMNNDYKCVCVCPRWEAAGDIYRCSVVVVKLIEVRWENQNKKCYNQIQINTQYISSIYSPCDLDCAPALAASTTPPLPPRQPNTTRHICMRSITRSAVTTSPHFLLIIATIVM